MIHTGREGGERAGAPEGGERQVLAGGRWRRRLRLFDPSRLLPGAARADQDVHQEQQRAVPCRAEERRLHHRQH